MSEARETRQNQPHRNEIGRPMPRRFSRPARIRFERDRRRRYLAELPCGPPTNQQAARIESLIRCEWFALKAEAEGTLQGDREAREHRRLLDRLLVDFERGLAPSAPPQKTLAEHLAAKQAAREAAQ
jgi:hypothetical protein